MTERVRRRGFSAFFASGPILETLVRDSNDAITLQDLDGGIHAWNHGAERMYGYTEAEALAMNIAAITLESDDGTLDYLREIRDGAEGASQEVRRRTKDGRILTVWLTTTRVNVDDATLVATTERDITQWRRQDELLRSELATRERMNRISSTYLKGSSEGAILDEILDAAIDISEAAFGNIQILEPASGDLTIVRHRGFPSSWIEFWNRASQGHGTCGTALRRRDRVIVEDVTRDPIFMGTEALKVQLSAGVRAVQSTPLIGRAGVPIGMLSTHYREPRRPPPRALAMLDLLAGRAAEVIERARLDAALRRSEATAAGILAVSADALISIDAEMIIRRWNAAAERMFGYSRTEAIGASLDLVIPERHRQAHRCHVAKFAEEPGGARTMDHRAAVGLRANGEEFPISATISKFATAEEMLMTVSIRDVTEARRVEQEQSLLAALGGALASADYSATLQSVARLVVASLAEFAVLFVEQGSELQRVTGASRLPELDASARRIMEVSLAPEPDHPVWAAVTTRRTVTLSLSDEDYPTFARSPEHLAALQSARPRSMMCVPFVVGTASRGVLCLARASRAFEPCDVLLAEEVARRLALYVDNARLHRVEQQSIRARDELLAIVAHDLRNPLTTIGLHAQALRQQTGFSGPANTIARTVRRMTRIVEDLLDVARLDTGRLAVTREVVPAATLLGSAEEAASGHVTDCRLTLSCESPDTLPMVYADPHRIQQVFDNLVANAVKFTKGGSVTIGARPHEDEVEFWVADTGSGIEPDHLAHVFDRFWQARPTTRIGAGLGLTIAKGIIDAHGGHMRVESILGVGTTITFTLPVAPRAALGTSEPERQSSHA